MSTMGYLFVLSGVLMVVVAIFVHIPTKITGNLERHPWRPLMNGERKARWSAKYYPRMEAQENGFPWKWRLSEEKN